MSASNEKSRAGNGFTKFLLLGSAAAILPMSAAHAQAGGEDAAAENDHNIIIVTATKRATDIQDVPASITSISGDDLAERGLNDIEGLATQVPNLSYGRYLNSTFVTIRGIGTTVDSGVAEPSVALYVDGVFLPRSTMATLRQVDLERAEVLRGPQGTLYGRNATGGAVNFVSRDPSSTFEGGINATVESRNGYRLNGYVLGPLGDSVSVRVSGGFEKQDGYVDVVNTGDRYGGTDLYHGRLAFRFELSDSATLDFSVQHEQNEDDFVWLGLGTAPVGVLGFYQAFAPPGTPAPNFTTEPNKIYADTANQGLLKTTIASARLNWELSDSVSLRSTTGYIDHTSATTQDSDGTDVLFVDLVDTQVTSESFSQEIDLFGETGPVSWLVGGYYFDEKHNLLGGLAFDTLALTLGSGVPFDPALLPLFGMPTTFQFANLEENTQSYAVFADVTIDLTDNFRILAGARMNWEDKDYLFFGAPSPAGSLDTSDFLPKVGLQYDASADVNFYAQWQKGIKSGGHQLSLPSLFAPEEVEAFEGGIKSQTADGRLTFNASAFFYDYSNLQATITIPPNTTLVENGDAEIYGLEAELFWEPIENLNLNFGATFLESKYTDLSSSDQTLPGAPVTDLSGEEVIRTPNFTFNAGAAWTIPVDSGVLGSVTFRGDLFYSDSFKLGFFPYPETTQGSYATANLSVTLTDSSDRFQLRGFLNNVTDKLYLNNAAFLATIGAFNVNHTEPRNGGVSLSVKF